MGSIYIAVILICRVVQHLCGKTTSNKINNVQTFLQFVSYRSFISGALALLLILFAANGFKCNLPTVLISLMSGICLTASAGFSIYAMKSGTVALTSMFSTAGLIIPVVAGVFLFGKPVSLGQVIGMLLFFCAAFLLISSSKKMYSGFSVKTLLMLLGILLAEGCTMLAQQMFAYYIPDGDVAVFSFFSFSIPAVIIGAYVLLKDRKSFHISRELSVLGAAQAGAVFVINQLATLAAALVSPVILFTFINGGSTVIGAVVAALAFREKLTLRTVIGVLLGVSALIIIKMF